MPFKKMLLMVLRCRTWRECLFSRRKGWKLLTLSLLQQCPSCLSQNTGPHGGDLVRLSAALSSVLQYFMGVLEITRALALSSGKLFSGFNLHVFGSSNCQLPLKQVIVRSISLREHLLFLNHRMRVVSSAERNRCFSSYCLPNVGRKFK